MRGEGDGRLPIGKTGGGGQGRVCQQSQVLVVDWTWVPAFLQSTFRISSPVLQVVTEADGYQPYLLSPEKGLRLLIKKSLELAKQPSLDCVDEVRGANSCLQTLHVVPFVLRLDSLSPVPGPW